MKEIRILGIRMDNRIAEAGEMQKVLTKYGCNIKTRLGLHDVDKDHCSADGLILLELFGDPKECDALEKDLGAIKGLNVKKMTFA